MNTAIKAALLSGLVFPGSGQIYLKRYWRGLIIMFLAGLSLVIIVAMAAGAALEGIKAMQIEGKAADLNAMAKMAAKSPTDTASNYWTIFIVCCWIFSVIDAYRIGKRQGIRDAGTKQTP